MPLKRGRSKKTIRSNMHELRHGGQFARTARKYGAARARRQMVAIALKQSGKRRGGSRRQRRK